jgi:hypothetical protein
VAAAALRIGALPASGACTARDLLAVPAFDGQLAFEHGIVRLMGRDGAGAPVFVLARRRGWRAVTAALASAPRFGAPRPVLVNTMPAVNWEMRVGGFLSRALGLPGLGRPLVVHGTRRALPRLRRLAAVAGTVGGGDREGVAGGGSTAGGEGAAAMAARALGSYLAACGVRRAAVDAGPVL